MGPTQPVLLEGKTVNKSQLIDTLAARYEGNRKAAAHALESVLDTITREVAKGEKVAITGFGSFEKRVREARWVRNPQTGARIKAKKTSVPKFTAGADLKNVVSGAKKLPKLDGRRCCAGCEEGSGSCQEGRCGDQEVGAAPRRLRRRRLRRRRRPRRRRHPPRRRRRPRPRPPRRRPRRRLRPRRLLPPRRRPRPRPRPPRRPLRRRLRPRRQPPRRLPPRGQPRRPDRNARRRAVLHPEGGPSSRLAEVELDEQARGGRAHAQCRSRPQVVEVVDVAAQRRQLAGHRDRAADQVGLGGAGAERRGEDVVRRRVERGAGARRRPRRTTRGAGASEASAVVEVGGQQGRQVGQQGDRSLGRPAPPRLGGRLPQRGVEVADASPSGMVAQPAAASRDAKTASSVDGQHRVHVRGGQAGRGGVQGERRGQVAPPGVGKPPQPRLAARRWLHRQQATTQPVVARVDPATTIQPGVTRRAPRPSSLPL